MRAGITTLLAIGLAILVLAGSASASHDPDGDYVNEERDNCPEVFNTDQIDSDGDGRGNTCDDSKGIPPGYSYFIVYIRDENGRNPIERHLSPRFRLTTFNENGGVFQTTEVNFYVVTEQLTAPGYRYELEQVAPPQGCTGGLAGTLRHSYTPGVWRPVTITYRCSSGSGGGGTPPPPATFTDSFAAAGETKPHALKITAATPVAEIALTWADRRDRFDLAAVQNVRRTSFARPTAEEQAPTKLKITRRRTATSVTVRVEKLKPGTLKFKVIAKAVRARARVVTRVSRRAR